MITKVETKNAPTAIGPYSQAIEAGNFIFVSGQLPVDPSTGSFPSEDIEVLTGQSLRNISAILDNAGSSMEKIVKTTIFLKDIKDFPKVNEVYATFFGDTYPARSCVEVSTLPKGAKIEIEAIALK